MKRKIPKAASGEERRMSGVRHFYASEQGQREALGAAIQVSQAQIAAEPFARRKPFWSK